MTAENNEGLATTVTATAERKEVLVDETGNREKIQSTVTHPLQFTDDGKITSASMNGLTASQWKQWMQGRVVDTIDPFIPFSCSPQSEIAERVSVFERCSKVLKDKAPFSDALLSLLKDFVDGNGKYNGDAWEALAWLVGEVDTAIPSDLLDKMFEIASEERNKSTQPSDSASMSSEMFRTLQRKGHEAPEGFWDKIFLEEQQLLADQLSPTYKDQVNWDRWNSYANLVVCGLKLDENNLGQLMTWLSKNEDVFEEQRLHHILDSNLFCSVRGYKERHPNQSLPELFPDLIDWNQEGVVRNYLLNLDRRTSQAVS